MNNQIQIFTNQLFGNLRCIIDDNGNPWFIGAEVASCLGYSNTRDALINHVDDEDKNTVAIHDGIPGNPNKVIINESGLYSLIFGSKLPVAKQFKHWVTSEVLPTMRKVGFGRSMQVLQEENCKLKEEMGTYMMGNYGAAIRAADQSVMRGQMIEKIKSVPDNILSEEWKKFLIRYDEEWEG